MKFKNVVEGEKYILKGNREDWHYTHCDGEETQPREKDLFAGGDIVVATTIYKDGDVNVRDAETMENLICVNCKFLKKIKDKA